jgi:hypothetical protein
MYDSFGAMFRRLFPHAGPSQIIAPRRSVPTPSPTIGDDGTIQKVWGNGIDVRY